MNDLSYDGKVHVIYKKKRRPVITYQCSSRYKAMKEALASRPSTPIIAEVGEGSNYRSFMDRKVEELSINSHENYVAVREAAGYKLAHHILEDQARKFVQSFYKYPIQNE